MHKNEQTKWLGACLLGGAIILIFGASCLYSALKGGPAWLSGHEPAVFLKLSVITLVAILVDICWMPARPSNAGE